MSGPLELGIRITHEGLMGWEGSTPCPMKSMINPPWRYPFDCSPALGAAEITWHRKQNAVLPNRATIAGRRCGCTGKFDGFGVRKLSWTAERMRNLNRLQLFGRLVSCLNSARGEGRGGGLLRGYSRKYR